MSWFQIVFITLWFGYFVVAIGKELWEFGKELEWEENKE